MNTIIEPTFIQGEIIAPPSKSLMQRASAAALIRKGETIIHNVGMSNDDTTAVQIIQNLGATVNFFNDTLIINSNGFSSSNIVHNKYINCHESGLCLRMFTPIIALHNEAFVINGTGSLLNRPIHFFQEVLPQLNIAVQLNNGLLPLKIKGSLMPKNIDIDASIGSQFLTGILFAYASFVQNDTSCLVKNTSLTIKANNLKSKQYIDVTLQVLKDFGLPFPENNQYETFVFHQHNIPLQHNSTLHYTIENDWSSAAFLLVAGAINGNVVIKNLQPHSLQPDKKIIDVLKNAGANISFQNNDIKITKSSLQPFEFDATHCPDLFPPLVALAAYCNGTSIIKGVHRLTHKESNRSKTLQEEFAKMGVAISVDNDVMKIVGNKNIQAAEINVHQDHRIAMATAVAALQANGKTTIHHSEVVQKSYPMFFKHLQQLGANLQESFS
ncbi:MAG: 3-phosphoshikimate 1-carboxyvinyltransferase [Chitinophagaceae bacterium]|nr:3-phosphoshikimate 1-carboxyvinyltransferase [Chitinophagaceae bacterium]MCW5905969.1 3-phosphoshikimate 1-carboxyvinyltransferase [Chitinophagaceae bacterium]